MRNLNDIVVGIARKWKERAKKDRMNRKEIEKKQKEIIDLIIK